MLPTYRSGDTLLGLRWFRPRPGRIVRLTRDEVWVEGDNPGFSTDSRHFGPVARTALEAVIVAKLGK
jgi:type IV secretory pathway protease TraF